MKSGTGTKVGLMFLLGACALAAPGLVRAQETPGPLPAPAPQLEPLEPARPTRSSEAAGSKPIPPRTSIVGAWKLNTDDSDDGRKKVQQAQSKNQGNGGNGGNGGNPRVGGGGSPYPGQGGGNPYPGQGGGGNRSAGDPEHRAERYERRRGGSDRRQDPQVRPFYRRTKDREIERRYVSGDSGEVGWTKLGDGRENTAGRKFFADFRPGS